MPSLSALTPDGQVLVVAAGQTVWIDRNTTGAAPAAVVPLPGPCVGVATTQTRIAALTADGVLVVADDAGHLVQEDLGAQGLHIDAAGDHIVAFTSTGLHRWSARGGLKHLSCDGIVTGAVAEDGRVAIATETSVRALEPDNSAMSEVGTEHPVTVLIGSTWSAGSHWYGAADNQVFAFNPGASARSHLTSTDAPITQLACSPEGHLVAIGVGTHLAVVLSLPDRNTVGQSALPRP